MPYNKQGWTENKMLDRTGDHTNLNMNLFTHCTNWKDPEATEMLYINKGSSSFTLNNVSINYTYGQWCGYCYEVSKDVSGKFKGSTSNGVPVFWSPVAPYILTPANYKYDGHQLYVPGGVYMSRSSITSITSCTDRSGKSYSSATLYTGTGTLYINTPYSDLDFNSQYIPIINAAICYDTTKIRSFTVCGGTYDHDGCTSFGVSLTDYKIDLVIHTKLYSYDDGCFVLNYDTHLYFQDEETTNLCRIKLESVRYYKVYV